MRPTTSTMLQQNNNNNYPCLDVSGSTRDLIQKCSRASLPFPSRLELGLADLPLIRGLRAWALFSKNRRKAGGLPGGGPAPAASPAGHSGSTSCPRSADVYLSGEWGRMGYGLPLGLDARQTGIGALVTVATLKTSEGCGKTQTQCLFLRTEKGSCLYSTARPGPGVATSAASSGVGGWRRGKTGGGGDMGAGRRDSGPTPPAHTGVNRLRVRSSRRWRKSSNTAAREKGGASREKQQSHIRLEERQEERDKGGRKPSPSLQQDSRTDRQEEDGAGRRVRQDDEACRRDRQEDEACRRDRQEEDEACRRDKQEEDEACRRDKQEEDEACRRDRQDGAGRSPPCSHKTCSQGRRAPRSQEESPRDWLNREVKERRKEVMKNEQEEEGGGCDVDQIKEAETQMSPSEDKLYAGFFQSGQVTGDFTSLPEGPEEEVSVVSDRSKDVSDSTSFPSISTAASPESSMPVGGSTLHENCGVQREPESSRERDLQWGQPGGGAPGILGKEELVVTRSDNPEPNGVSEENNTVNEREAPSSRLRHGDPSRSDLQEDPTRTWSLEDHWKSDHVGPKRETTYAADPSTSLSPSRGNPDHSPPPLGSMAMGPAGLEREEEDGVPAGDIDQEEKRNSTVATEEEREEQEEEKEEDGFGVFMQAEGEPAWSEGSTMSAPVHCGSQGHFKNQAVAGDKTLGTPGWTDQSDDSWTAFPQDWSDEGGDAAGQWWANSAVDEDRDRLSANHSLMALFAKVFPTMPGSSDPSDRGTIPTLTQVLRTRADQDQGLLDGFHDLNKMICRRNKRADGVSRELLLMTLNLEPMLAESRSAPWTANHHVSPGLPSANQHAQNSVAKRRLSYDDNIME